VKTAAYVRVSTAEQNTELQHRGIERFCAHAGLDVVAWYVDEAQSGRLKSRPELDRLMEVARARQLECVIVWKFDRFARSASHLIRALEEFDHLGMRFISVQDQIDTDSPMGRAMFTIIGAMAELESSLISERVKAGMAAVKAKGKHVGRPRTPARVIEEVERFAAETDLSIREIVRELDGGASRGVVGRVVKRVRTANSS